MILNKETFEGLKNGSFVWIKRAFFHGIAIKQENSDFIFFVGETKITAPWWDFEGAELVPVPSMSDCRVIDEAVREKGRCVDCDKPLFIMRGKGLCPQCYTEQIKAKKIDDTEQGIKCVSAFLDAQYNGEVFTGLELYNKSGAKSFFKTPGAMINAMLKYKKKGEIKYHHEIIHSNGLYWRH